MLKECIIGLFGVVTGGAIGYFTKKKNDNKKIDEAEKKLTMAYTVNKSIFDTEVENSKNLYRITEEQCELHRMENALWQERMKLEDMIDELQMLKYDAEMQEMMRENELKEEGITEIDVNKLISDARKIILESRELFDSDEDNSKDCYYYADDENLLNIKIERA